MESWLCSCIEYDRVFFWDTCSLSSIPSICGLEHPKAEKVNGLIPIDMIHSREDNDFVRSELLPHLETLDNVTISLCSPESLWGADAGATYRMPFMSRCVVAVSHGYLHDPQELSKANGWGESDCRSVKYLHQSFDTYLILIDNMKWDILFHSTNETLCASCLKGGLSEWSEEGNANKDLWKILHHQFNS